MDKWCLVAFLSSLWLLLADVYKSGRKWFQAKYFFLDVWLLLLFIFKKSAFIDNLKQALYKPGDFTLSQVNNSVKIHIDCTGYLHKKYWNLRQ